jgi:hypothetical protein
MPASLPCRRDVLRAADLKRRLDDLGPAVVGTHGAPAAGR